MADERKLPENSAPELAGVSHRTCENAVSWLAIWTAILAAGLLLATHSLWWWRGPDAVFVQVPLLATFVPAPQWIDQVLLLGLAAGLAGIVNSQVTLHRQTRTVSSGVTQDEVRLAGRSLAWGVVVVCGIGLILLDQQRLQPWFYQLLLVGVIFLLASRTHCLGLLRWLVIGIYAYSAIGKLDYQFMHTVGQDFLEVPLRWMGWDVDPMQPSTRIQLAFLLPASELLIALVLAVPRLRKMGGILACLFHLALIAVFSPLGLDHSLSVILWNVQFAGQAILLFWLPSTLSNVALAGTSSANSQRAGRPVGDRVATLFVLAISLMPILERAGMWDHWPSWALYAPHSSRTEVYVATTAVDRLPSGLAELIRTRAQARGMPDEAVLWQRVPLAEWCFLETDAPVYPQDRMGLAVAIQLTKILDTRFEVRAVIRGTAGRLDGRRSSESLDDTDAIIRASRKFLLNTTPRPNNS